MIHLPTNGSINMIQTHRLILPWAMALMLFSSIATAQEQHNAISPLKRAWLDAFGKATPNVAAFSVPSSDEELQARTKRRQQEVLRSTTPFLNPTEIESNNGYLSTALAVDYGEYAIGSHRVRLRTYNGSLVGPTLRAKPGDVLEIRLRNLLPAEPAYHGDHNELHGFNTTNLHTHGLHVSPKGRADNVLLTISPGQEFDYRIEIPDDHPPGTFWYHAHRHGSVAAQVSSGMSGAIIIEGALDYVPEIAAANDRVFVLQQIPYVLEHGIGVVEQRHAAVSFGPETWDALGRHTTINGQLFPVITVTQGQLERWRLIHSGVREGMGLRLIGIDGNAKGKSIPLSQIAWDGLPMGKSVDLPMVELFPGYRVDVLVKFPHEGFDGTYLLEDATIEPAVSVFTQDANFHPKYIAKIVVKASRDGASPIDMRLPSPEQLAEVKQRIELLDDLANVNNVGTQMATYSIDIVSGAPKFSIDGRSFSQEHVRGLKLGTVDEWTLKSINGAGDVDHPFHIHVNPFQITQVIDDEGHLHPEMLGWRDTLLLRDSWTYKVRMKYQRYTGTFVQHCHILDHEDQGMMELVEIYDPDGPAGRPPQPLLASEVAAPIELQDHTGQKVSWDYSISPTLALLFRGNECLHCQEQLKVFSRRSKALRDAGLRLVAISTDNVEELGRQVESLENADSFVFLSDTSGKAAQSFGCAGDSSHGTFLINRDGTIRWQDLGNLPFTDVAAILKKAGDLKNDR
tara:strand:- start:23259 stop:25478 length:2220 start_codon:yes stop_codon:yes gene_type:complete